jgi:hypothetical protein
MIARATRGNADARGSAAYARLAIRIMNFPAASYGVSIGR